VILWKTFHRLLTENNAMTANTSIDPAEFLHDQLAAASPDLPRDMLTTFIQALMSGSAISTPGLAPWTSRPPTSREGQSAGAGTGDVGLGHSTGTRYTTPGQTSPLALDVGW
jgi:hypothetical protein